jgi:hypothetical protein
MQRIFKFFRIKNYTFYFFSQYLCKMSKSVEIYLKTVIKNKFQKRVKFLLFWPIVKMQLVQNYFCPFFSPHFGTKTWVKKCVWTTTLSQVSHRNTTMGRFFKKRSVNFFQWGTLNLSYNYLGLVIDEKLSWIPHIEKVSKKISPIIAILKKIQYFVDLKTLEIIYNSFINSHLTYLLPIWGSASDTRIIKKKRFRIYFDFTVLQ